MPLLRHCAYSTVRVLGWLVLVVAGAAPALAAAQAAARSKASESTGGFVVVPSPITSAVFRGVQRQCEALLNDGARYIVFEIQPGTSDYGNCLNLAHYVESITGAKTVAYVTQPLSGHAVMVALAADELVMSRKATLGDIGRDEPFIRPGMLAEYSELARRRQGPYRAVILGMLDKNTRVWRVATARDTRYVLDEDLKQLEAEEPIKSKEPLIEAGQLGNFTGDQARELGLAKLIAETRVEVAEFYGLSPKTAIAAVRVGVEWKPVRIRIADFVDPIMQEYVRRHVKESLERGKNFFIFEIDSPGGHAEVGLEMAELIKELRGVKTVAYIPDQAISAAAFIALGCDEIIMRPDAKLGDCGVMFVEGGQFHYVEEKRLSYYRTALEILAKAKGYSPALAVAMIDKDLVVKEVRDPRTGRSSFLSEKELTERAQENLEVRRTVKDKGSFLTMDGPTAQSLDFARDLVDNFDGLRALYGLENVDVTMVNPNWVDTLIWVLNQRLVAVILVVVGVLGLYLELKLPGVLLPGIVAGLCFLLFFWSHVMGGTAGWLEVVLFLAGLLLLGLEILVIPGFGVCGVTGILLMVASIVLASQTFVLPESPSEWQELATNLGTAVFVFACLFTFAYVIAKYLPDMPLLSQIVLKTDLTMAGAESAGFNWSPFQDLLGAEGVALTALRPAGRVRFGDQFVDVVSDGTYIQEGAQVRVIEVSGNRVLVKQV